MIGRWGDREIGGDEKKECQMSKSKSPHAPLDPPGQVPPQRGFYPGGRPSWAGG